MLAALVIMTLAAAFVLVVVAAFGGLHAVETADAEGWRAEALAAQALGEVAAGLRWGPMTREGEASGGGVASGDAAASPPSGSWRAEWWPAPAVAGDAWPRVRARVDVRSGRARRVLDAGMDLRAELWASGVVCAGDAEVAAPLVVTGSGVYVGGSLRGRELVGFSQGAGPATPAGAPADVVHGDVYPEAAVHARAGIYAHGAEIHEPPVQDEWPFDTDEHTAGSGCADCVARPWAAFLAAAAEHGASLGAAFDGTTLRLDQLDLPASGSERENGRCVITPPLDEVRVVGSLPVDAGRLLLVVRGDAVLGDDASETALAGALVVCGELRVAGDSRIAGSVYAGRVRVTAPLRVVVSSDWREYPLAGACAPVLREVGV